MGKRLLNTVAGLSALFATEAAAQPSLQIDDLTQSHSFLQDLKDSTDYMGKSYDSRAVDAKLDKLYSKITGTDREIWQGTCQILLWWRCDRIDG